MNIEKRTEPQSLHLDENLLHSEIQFWRELIASQDSASNGREATERMQQALALAEYRLASAGSNQRLV